MTNCINKQKPYYKLLKKLTESEYKYSINDNESIFNFKYILESLLRSALVDSDCSVPGTSRDWVEFQVLLKCLPLT